MLESDNRAATSASANQTRRTLLVPRLIRQPIPLHIPQHRIVWSTRRWIERNAIPSTVTAIGPKLCRRERNRTPERAMPCTRSPLRIYCPSSRKSAPASNGRGKLEHLPPCYWKQDKSSDIVRRWGNPAPTDRVRWPHCNKPRRSC